MSLTNLSRGGDDFRAAAGLASWSPDALDLAPETAPVPRGPGLFEVITATGQRVVTNIRRLAGAERTPGSALILAATVLLGLLAAGLFVVSLAAQYRYVLEVKHVALPSAIEAVGLDVGMAVFSLLALGLAMAGQSARTERALIVVCAVASARAELRRGGRHEPAQRSRLRPAAAVPGARGRSRRGRGAQARARRC